MYLSITLHHSNPRPCSSRHSFRPFRQFTLNSISGMSEAQESWQPSQTGKARAWTSKACDRCALCDHCPELSTDQKAVVGKLGVVCLSRLLASTIPSINGQMKQIHVETARTQASHALDMPLSVNEVRNQSMFITPPQAGSRLIYLQYVSPRLSSLMR